MTKLKLTLSLLALPAAALLFAAPAQKIDRDALAACWFERPYEYMFANIDSGRPDDSEKTVSLFGKQYGMYTAGPDGILFYGGLDRCLGRLIGAGKIDRFKTRHVDAAAGVPARLDAGGRNGFAVYNPAIIRWGARTLIPDPGDKLDGVKYQEIYDVVFARLGRMMVESYLLFQRKDAPAEQLAYLRALATRDNFSGPRYLKRRYGGELKQYAYAENGTAFLPSQAIGFWLRRSIDGTDREIWQALSTFMERYDRDWFRKKNR